MNELMNVKPPLQEKSGGTFFSCTLTEASGLFFFSVKVSVKLGQRVERHLLELR